MEYKKLNELCDINIGKTPSRNNKNFWGIGIDWLSISDLKSKYILSTKEQITENAFNECKMKLVPQDTVVMSFKLSIGKTAILKKDMCTNEAIANFPVKNSELLTPQYLYYALKTLNFDNNADRAVMGATLNKSKLNELKIPYTNINIQNKIVEVLDKAQDLIDKRKEQIEALDELIKSVFYDMFGDPLENPKGFKKEKLNFISSIITGNTPSRKETENYGDHIEWIKSDNINTPFDYITKAEEYLSKIGMKKGRIVDSGSILMTCIAGSLNCIGNIALTDRQVSFNQQINGIICNKKQVNNKFLYTQFNLSKHYIQGASTNGMKGMISKGTLSELEFMVPPLNLQKKYQEIFDLILKQKKLLQESLSNLEDNFNALMQRAFKGELFSE